MNTYQVTARRWGYGWELDIDGVGVTQSRTLATAAATVRSYLAMDDYDDAETAEIVVTPELDGNLATEAEAARDATRQAERAQRDAAAKQRRVAHSLRESGLSGREIATVLQMTPQRVSQLINAS